VRERGLLIVNADDFGGNRLATDRILECFGALAITSTSAMMYMSDSTRAASIACSHELPVGLHLNLTQPFEALDAPEIVRARQKLVVRHFAGNRLQRISYNPRLARLVRQCIVDQLACFRALYRRDPTHIDGHNHAHLSPTVLMALPKGTITRTAERAPGANRGMGATARRARQAFIAHRHLTTEYFLAIDRLEGSPEAEGIERLLAPADRATVEIMTHPDRDSDYRLLLSKQWREALQRHTLGSFRALRTGARSPRTGAPSPREDARQ
jgi:predicted glycoside hydrolase/deacetylase ChbG (UPF0249 family)